MSGGKVEFAGVRIEASLLESALTHKSFAIENTGIKDNQRLEFLGDAVIELAFSDHLFRSFTGRSEGQLTVQRAAAVSETSLAHVARALDLGVHLRLGRGEEKTGGRERDSVLADAFEALVGAIYLSNGWQAAQEFVIDVLTSNSLPSQIDYKGKLQRLLQASSPIVPSYRVVEESGPDHEKHFTVVVVYQGECMGLGRGYSKKEAEQRAAKATLRILKTDD